MKSYITGLLSVILVASPSYAMDQVTVTATKRNTPLHALSQSASSFEAAEVERQGTTDLKTLSLRVPNAHVSQFAAQRTNYVYFRGIGSGLGDPAVQTYVDGVPQLSGNTSNFNWLNVERVEWLRGPQGAMYGRNAMGGIIHVQTKALPDSLSARTHVTVGDYNAKRAALFLSTPISEKSKLGFGYSLDKRHGYTENTSTGQDKDYRDGNQWMAQWEYAPTDTWTLSYKMRKEENSDGDYAIFSLSSLRQDSHLVSHDFDGNTNRNLHHHGINVTHFGDTANFHSITGFNQWAADESTDLDMTANDFLRRFTREHMSQFYQELRWQNPADNPATLLGKDVDWLAGVSLTRSAFRHDSSTESRPTLIFVTTSTLSPSNYTVSDYDTTDVAYDAFAQGTLWLSDQWEATTGIRLTHESKKADVTTLNTDISQNETQFLPKLGASYHGFKFWRPYGYVEKGFRAGGFNKNTVAGGDLEYDPETLWTVELGMKTKPLPRFAANVAIFKNWWNDMQLNTPHPTSAGRFVLTNAGEAESYGYEVDGTYAVDNVHRVSAGWGWTRATFQDYIEPGSNTSANERPLPNVPNHTLYMAYDYTRELKHGMLSRAHIEWRNTGHMVFDVAGNADQPHHNIINMSVGIDIKGWQFDAFLHNVFNKNYQVLAFQSPISFLGAGPVGRSGAPRTFGVSATASF